MTTTERPIFDDSISSDTTDTTLIVHKRSDDTYVYTRVLRCTPGSLRVSVSASMIETPLEVSFDEGLSECKAMFERHIDQTKKMFERHRKEIEKMRKAQLFECDEFKAKYNLQS